MGRRDNLKILTTAILVVLLLSSFIFAFIYRNEIYQKLQTIGKNKEVEMVDREITKAPDSMTPPKDLMEEPNERESREDRSKLPELPSLDDMEPESQRPRSVSVASGAKTREPKDSSSRLQEKLDQVEEQISPKENKESQKPKTKEVVKKQSVSETPQVTSKNEEDFSSEPKTTVQRSKQGKLVKETSTVTPKSKRKKSSSKLSYKTQTTTYKESNVSKKTNSKQTVNSSSLEVRMKEVEQKLNSSNDRNEKRFLEIERRIDSLEKALAK
ncbi:hypothetical protein CH369_07920 [Leptospira levettii]|uniref:hypothetical protein n=2 Tax=Leptospira levettii TaxID=2023178 RepID=UPI000C29BF04|nr:hypothetical protein [Leptospira levettii]PKA00406.1 hypothetical protein CH369_07920 [Leptospira levettii]TGL11301.1 hypothetical protein EHQ39_06965 [Leptospira levettii]